MVAHKGHRMETKEANKSKKSQSKRITEKESDTQLWQEPASPCQEPASPCQAACFQTCAVPPGQRRAVTRGDLETLAPEPIPREASSLVQGLGFYKASQWF